MAVSHHQVDNRWIAHTACVSDLQIFLFLTTGSWHRHWGCFREEEVEKESELQTLPVVSGQCVSNVRPPG